MKRSRALEILTPADGIADLLNEPLERIEAMITAGNCPKPVFKEGMSQPRWRDSDIPAWVRLLRGDRLSPDSGLEPIGSILGRVMGALGEMPIQDSQTKRPATAATERGPESNEIPDINDRIQGGGSPVNSYSKATPEKSSATTSTYDDGTGCDLVILCQASKLLSIPIKIVWDSAALDPGFPSPVPRDVVRSCSDTMKDCPDFFNLYGCHMRRWPDVVEWYEGARNG